MDDLGKLAAAAVLGTLLALSVRRQNPDIALVIVLAAGAVLYAGLTLWAYHRSAVLYEKVDL